MIVVLLLFLIFQFLKRILDHQKLLEGPQGSENARFGSAIAALADIDLDGFNDVVIGAPLENQNSGAIYIYNGFQKTIRTKYSQVNNCVANAVLSAFKSAGGKLKVSCVLMGYCFSLLKEYC